MCGIAGLIHFDGAHIPESVLKSMTDAIVHRGPDGEGQWIEKNVGIGHRRLAILDLSKAAHQPMISEDDAYVLSYNGEIYNFRELRLELEAEGIRFRSNTDSEVVLYALAQWGVKALNRFNGMFALALWNRHKKTLLLARDRYGIKPLYTCIQGSIFAFGSEQKAILAYTKVQRRLDKSALIEYLTFQNIFTNRTLLQDIHLFPAGHYATIDLGLNSPDLKLTKYWDYHFQEPKTRINENEYREELDRLFKQAVNRQLVSDVELGCYLSGGMDSGSISAIASKKFANLKSFTCGFDISSASGMELAFDERAQAESMSACFKTEHYEMVLKAGDMERCLPRLAYHLEEPRVGQSYPNYYAAHLASKFVKVILSGAGGDELFGGYPWRYYRAAVNQNFEHYIDQYYLFWQRLIPNSAICEIFRPIWGDVKDVWTRDIFREVFLSHQNELKSPEDYINHSIYFEAKTFLHGLFVVEDKLSMAHSMETRVPFMDNDLVEFAMRCPVRMKLNKLDQVININENLTGKLNQYYLKTNDGKQILRDVMSNYIPSKIVSAAKQGFSAPDGSWFKGESIDFVKNQLQYSQAEIYNYLDYSAVNKLIDEHLAGKQNRRLLIWSLLNLEQWFQSSVSLSHD